MKHRIFFILALTSMTALARDPVESVESDPMGGGTPVTNNSPTSTSTKEIPAPDPMGGATTPTSETTTNQAQETVAESSTPSDPLAGKKTVPPLKPLTPEIANLNLPSEVEVPNEDPNKVLYLPAGTYRQILQIPIDSPTMESANQMRIQRSQEVKIAPVLPHHPRPTQNLSGSDTSHLKKSK